MLKVTNNYNALFYIGFYKKFVCLRSQANHFFIFSNLYYDELDIKTLVHLFYFVNVFRFIL